MDRRAEPPKKNAEAKRPLAGKTPKDEGARVRDLEKGLAEAREQQVATTEILRVISSSPTDVQPVFDTIVRSAVRLCDGLFSALFRFDGEMIHHGALHNVDPKTLDEVLPVRPSRAFLPGRAILERAVVHIPDVELDPEFQYQSVSRAIGFRSGLWVPMLREGNPIGVISVARAEPGPFSHSEIALLQTFAEQAVIAIENVRLFTETKDALERQTATSEVLNVISSSPTAVRPVFEAICRSAVRLFGAHAGAIIRFDGHLMHLGAVVSPSAEAAERYRQLFPRPLDPELLIGRAILDRTVVHIADVEQAESAQTRQTGRDFGYRRVLIVPMLREGEAIGTLNVTGREPGFYSDRQVALLQTFTDQAVIAIENVRLFKELEASNRELTTALDTQTATSDILGVISRSQADVQPVFEAIAENAARLVQAWSVTVLRWDGESIHLAAERGGPPGSGQRLRDASPWLPNTTSAPGRCIATGTVIHVPDVDLEPEDDTATRELAHGRGWRSNLCVPMLCDGSPIGAISVTRVKAGPFSPGAIALLQTFADQAVIAIENARLLSELQDRNEALTQAHSQVTEALEQQTATSEILRVISSSPTDAQPVFDTIVRSSDRLLGGLAGSLALRVGDEVHLVALTPTNPEGDAVLRRLYPVPIGQDGTHAEVVRLCRPRMITDTETELTGRTREFARTRGFRSRLSVPLIRDGIAIGSLGVTRPTPGAFTDREIALLQTFADQAVIAIENVRLFTELQTSNRELTTALDTQTATSDILRVISRSQTDVQPVFDAIVASAVRLLGGYFAGLTRIAGDQIELAALTSTDDAGNAALKALYPRPVHSQGAHGQAIRDRAPVNILDMHTDLRVTEAGRDAARIAGYRSVVTVPLLRHDEAIGALGVTRRDPGGFTDDEIALLQTFADQAVIAIENVRLFRELEARTQDLTRSVGELRALGEVGQAISSTLDLQTVLSTIVARATQLSGTDAGVIYEYDAQREVFVPRATEHLEAEIVETMLATPVRKGEGATGRLAEVPEPIQVPDILAAPAESRVRGALVRAGYRALLAVPLVRDDHLLGGLTVIRKAPGAFAPEVTELLRTFATQSALAIQNARLFREIDDKSRQLAAASQHKSDFLANMSHELRTPLNAIIGYSEMLEEDAADLDGGRLVPDLQKIATAAKHQLSLINDILDLSKVEAGRMELEVTDFDLPRAIDNALVLVRERASRRGIRLGSTIDERLGMIGGDERKVKQVLLNLLSNALKFTSEGGRIDVRAGVHDGVAEVSVADTGVGIAPEDQEAVFEEFRQVGTADKKVEGTGLGLALSRKFIELHGGRIWVKSQVGQGSTFTFTLPVRREE